MFWIAAAYFPPTSPTFPDIQSKFDSDAAGVANNSASGFAFFVNQHLTIGERQKLISRSPALRTEIYHLERISSLLNAPKGCGLRLEYLRIPMTEAEQWAFWSTMNADIIRRLTENEKRQATQIEKIDQKLDVILKRTSAMEFDLQTHPSSILHRKPLFEHLEMPTSSLSITMICWLHRIVTEDSDLPEAVRGRFRAVQVWIGSAGSSPEDASYVPIPPVQILPQTTEFLEWWHNEHVRLRNVDKNIVGMGLAQFHYRFFQIHPFLDGNGRVARLLLDQAARELLNQGVGKEGRDHLLGSLIVYEAGLLPQNP